ncbi:DUF397 domain-containing protein [Microbispora hainanensis]|uniref:DUF397 domain-containing protein n=1 Tax=Microbispora hainanensis TaxID=568844 RepID=A0A544Y7H5_9ACTN|nr:DUF397 domain-containing protein [Microbispora hainanensis]
MMQPTSEGSGWITPCNGGNCVEVAFRDGRVDVRDGKCGEDSPILSFTAEEWQAFVQEVKVGRFDVP